MPFTMRGITAFKISAYNKKNSQRRYFVMVNHINQTSKLQLSHLCVYTVKSGSKSVSFLKGNNSAAHHYLK